MWPLCCLLALVSVVFVVVVAENPEIEEEVRVLRKQVGTLLDRRKDDFKSLQDNIVRKILDELQLDHLREGVQKIRYELDQVRGGNGIPLNGMPSKDENEHLKVKWLSSVVSELKTELAEMQSALNSTVILQNHEQVDTELRLLKSDVSNLNQEVELERKKNAQYEAELIALREDFASLRDHSQAVAVMCGKTKNQLKAVQLEWNHNWKSLFEKKKNANDFTDLKSDHPSRHQRALKRHIIDLEKTSQSLQRENARLSTHYLKIEEELELLKNYVKNKDSSSEYDRINGNEIENFIAHHKIQEVQMESNGSSERFDQRITDNYEAVANLTKQMSNFDKLHMSMLELLENVESIENKVDVNLPEFRKEISKLEVQIADAVAQIALVREEQVNSRKTVKAIGVSVSNLQKKTEDHRQDFIHVRQQVDALIKVSSTQTSKLHDHILKSESSTLDTNSTKSTIHLVQELKSFENEYKSIVNKLPHDCSAVSGPSGIYLISPGDGEPILAYCEEGWTIVQKRYDGSVNFNRNWNDYSNGFGSATGEHWLGNRNLHHLTNANCTKLQINMKDIYGKYWQANYDRFTVGDYSIGFKLEVSNYTGNASDAFNYQNLMEFSTVDNDRDISNTHCASNYEGGWWFSHCQHANLNGRYNLGLTWFDSSRNEWIAVAQSEMRVKPRQVC